MAEFLGFRPRMLPANACLPTQRIAGSRAVQRRLRDRATPADRRGGSQPPLPFIAAG